MISLTEFNRELFIKARKTKTPVLGAFELTNRCNLRCRMCYVSVSAGDEAARRSELSSDEWLSLGREATREGLLYLLLTGGEPLLRPDFHTIYEGLYKLGLLISVNTNATLVTPEIAKRLAQRPPRRVSVTLYGADAETYGAVCGDPGAFERTLRGIRLLKDYGLSVNLRTTLIRQNRNNMDAIHELSRELGIHLKLVDYIFAPRSCVGQEPFDVRLTPYEQDACTRQFTALVLADKAPKDEQRQEKEPSLEDKPVPADGADVAGVAGVAGVAEQDEPDVEELTDAQDERQDGAFRCAAGHFSFAVNSVGRLCTCLMIDEPSAAKDEGTFRSRWEKLVELSAAVPVCEDCERCDIRGYCKVCPAKIKGETGLFTQKPAYVCEIARLAAARASASA